MVVEFTDLRRDPEHGFWRARLTAGDLTLDADRRSGSWLLDVPAGLAVDEDGNTNTAPQRREVLPWIAADLQARVRKIEAEEA